MRTLHDLKMPIINLHKLSAGVLKLGIETFDFMPFKFLIVLEGVNLKTKDTKADLLVHNNYTAVYCGFGIQ